MIIKNKLAMLAGLALAGCLAGVPSTAGASTNHVKPIHITSGIMNGLALDASGWGGAGKCSEPRAGDPLVIWTTARAGCAGDWHLLSKWQVEYAPDGILSNLCVTANPVIDVQWRLERCTPGGSQSQNLVALSSVIGGWMLVATGETLVDRQGRPIGHELSPAMNNRGYGGDGSHIISWLPDSEENETWDVPGAV